MDVMDAISKQLRFNYTLHQSPDGKIGSVTRLNGVFGELTGGVCFTLAVTKSKSLSFFLSFSVGLSEFRVCNRRHQPQLAE